MPRGGAAGTQGQDTEPAGTDEVESDGMVEADVGSVEFDETILQSSQDLVPLVLAEPPRIPGCPAALAEAYFVVYVDESITDELVVDRFGLQTLQLFKGKKHEHLAALEGGTAVSPGKPMDVMQAQDETSVGQGPPPEECGVTQLMDVAAGVELTQVDDSAMPGTLYDSRETREPDKSDNSAANVVGGQRGSVATAEERSNVLQLEAPNACDVPPAGYGGYGASESSQVQGSETDDGSGNQVAGLPSNPGGGEAGLAGHEGDGEEHVPGAEGVLCEQGCE